MKTFLLSFAGGFLALILFFLVLPLIIIGVASSGSKDVRPEGPIVLQVDMRYGLPDQPPSEGLAGLFGQTSFIDVITRLDAAADDPDVEGVFLRASEWGVGSARAEELRSAIMKLRKNGKFVIAHSQGFYMGTPSAYRAISAADEIWMQQGTDFAVSGVSLETLFFKDLLDKLEVSAEIEALYEYKNAPNVYKESGFTEAHELALRELGEDIWRISLNDIQADRGEQLKLNMALREALESSPYSAMQAVEMGLADKLGWPEDAIREAETRGGDATLIDIAEYMPPELDSDAPVIALIGGEGPIVTGYSGGDYFDPNASSMIASDTIASQIYDAGENEDVQAIVFRVDSPGGSPTASDQIWKAIEYVQETHEKPVVISMGSVAASGGYYVSMGADRILASNATITGSIGIFGGKFAIADALRKYGINAERIDVGGQYAATFTSVEKLSDFQREKLVDSLKRGYDRFTELAAEGRGMSQGELHNVAKGRVWSGEAALKEGLVDEIGGLMAAVDSAKALAGIEQDTNVHLMSMTPQMTPFEALGAMFSASSQHTNELALMARIASDKRVSTIAQQLQAMNDSPTQMSMSPVIEH